MTALEQDNFDEMVKQGEGLILVDFWSESCDRCKELMPSVEELSKKYEGKVPFYKLDIKGKRRLAMKEGVMGLPSIVFYKGGEKLEHLTGEELDSAQIAASIEKHL